MVRIQLELSEERVAELDALLPLMGLKKRKDLFNNALTLLEWAVNEKKAGRKVASLDEGQRVMRELVMPALQAVLEAASNEADKRTARAQLAL